MDADDVAHPQRLAMQMSILTSHADVVLVGSVWTGIDRTGAVVRDPDYGSFRKPGLAAPFAHGSIMMRSDAFRKVGGYRGECDYWEDLDLYLRLSALGRMLVVPRPLYFHRFSEVSTRVASPSSRVERAVDLMFRCRRALAAGRDYAHLLERGLPVEEEDRKLHPDTFISLGSISLWSGNKPSVLRKLISRARLRLDWPTLRALIWAIWAKLSPGTLRSLMRYRLSWRNRRVAARIEPDRPLEWRPVAPGLVRSPTGQMPLHHRPSS
jgi:hypothetical protein